MDTDNQSLVNTPPFNLWVFRFGVNSFPISQYPRVSDSSAVKSAYPPV